MTEIQTIDPARRLVDLALTSTALPLPMSLIPSALPQDIVISDAAPAELPASQHDAAAEPRVGLLPLAAAPDAPIADEAVLNSVNAALDAVRVSLHDTAATVQADDAHLADVAPLSLVSPLNTFVTVSAAADTSEAPTAAAPATVAAVDAAAPSIAVTDVVTQTLPQADALLGTVGQIVGGLTETVGDVVEGVVHTVDAVVDGVVGNVLVPTLNGLGLDILNGLVPAPPQTASAHDSVSTAPQDAAVFDAIGMDTGTADHDVAHTPHAPQHLVGSGLI